MTFNCCPIVRQIPFLVKSVRQLKCTSFNTSYDKQQLIRLKKLAHDAGISFSAYQRMINTKYLNRLDQDASKVS